MYRPIIQITARSGVGGVSPRGEDDMKNKHENTKNTYKADIEKKKNSSE